jgi:putative ABC transport system substrate-binding protein
VASFNRPGAQVTGINIMATALSAKRLELLRELLPTSTAFGFIANPQNPVTEGEVKDMLAAAKAAGLQLDVLHAGTGAETSAAFDTLVEHKAAAAVIQADPVFLSERDQIAGIASHHGMPSIYSVRDYAVAGGLMSYGDDRFESERQAGIYVARIVMGAKPSDLPIQQPTKFNLVINLKAAKSIGLTISESFLLRADEVIE